LLASLGRALGGLELLLGDLHALARLLESRLRFGHADRLLRSLLLDGADVELRQTISLGHDRPLGDEIDERRAPFELRGDPRVPSGLDLASLAHGDRDVAALDHPYQRGVDARAVTASAGAERSGEQS
jgi:hypothetical protein